MAPQRVGLVPAVPIPPGEADVLVLCGFHFEAYGGSGGHDLSQLQFVQDGGPPHSIQAHHGTAHFFFVKKTLEEVCSDSPHAADRWEQHWPEKPLAASGVWEALL